MSDTPAKAARRKIRKSWAAGAALAALAAAIWIGRMPIADTFIADELESRGVEASYSITRIGLRTQRLSDIVIGDPDRPDLVARNVEVRLGWGFVGPYVASINAEGVRLYGRVVDEKLSFGDLDKFRDMESRDPFALPDLAVALSDARARIDTPWGDVGAALSGKGNLRRRFDGTLAIVAPSLEAGGCKASNVSFYGDLKVRLVRPHLKGPVRASVIDCPGRAMRAERPEVALDASMSEDLQNWKGAGNVAVSELRASAARARGVTAGMRFDGNADRLQLALDAGTRELIAGDFSARSVEIEAGGVVGAMAPRVEGRIRAASVSASPALQQSIIASVKGLDGSPVAPLATKASAALARLLAGAGGEVGFALAGEGRTARAEFFAPRLSGRNGARFEGAPDSRIAWIYGTPRSLVIANGRWSLGGGGLPSVNLTLNRRTDGRLEGTARIAPYAAPGARLALAPVAFSGDRTGTLRFATTARLTGPLGDDGRIEELRVPLAGRLTARGDVTIDGGCRLIMASRLSMSGFEFRAPRLSVCSAPRAPLLAAGPGGLRGAIVIPDLALRGASSGAALALDIGRAAIDLAAGSWTLRSASVRLGEGEAVTRFSADAVSGRAGEGGLAGDLSGARGKIGAVPLLMEEIGGRWTLVGGAVALRGGLVVEDAAADPRFFPLVSQNAELRYANGRIDAEAGFSERQTGAKILDAVIHHDLAASAGAADLAIDDLRFDETFQPDQLTRLALGVVANVKARVTGNGRIEWKDGAVTSEGRFATRDADLAAAFGPVTGLTTTLQFDDLIKLRSAPGQIATIREINPGIPVIDGRVEYRLLSANQVRIEGGRWPFGGGELLLHPTTLDFGADRPRRLTFDLVGVDAAVFLQQFGFDNIHATGIFDGTLPVEFDGLGGRIVDGRIDSRGGGGTLAYVGELTNHNLGAIANFAFGALRSLKYDDLTIVLNGDLDGEMVTDIRFGGVGQGEGATRNFLTRQIAKLPMVFNVKIKAPFRQLITSAKGFYDPTILIEQNLSTLLRAQEAAEAAARAKQDPVHSPESEPMQ